MFSFLLRFCSIGALTSSCFNDHAIYASFNTPLFLQQKCLERIPYPQLNWSKLETTGILKHPIPRTHKQKQGHPSFCHQYLRIEQKMKQWRRCKLCHWQPWWLSVFISLKSVCVLALVHIRVVYWRVGSQYPFFTCVGSTISTEKPNLVQFSIKITEANIFAALQIRRAQRISMITVEGIFFRGYWLYIHIQQALPCLQYFVLLAAASANNVVTLMSNSCIHFKV